MGIYDELSQLETTRPDAEQPAPAAQKPPETAAVTETPPADSVTPRRRDARHGVTTATEPDAVVALMEGIDLGRWREVLADTETHNSTYRLTEEERRVAEDLVRDLWRRDQVKTSMNEVARLGLMLLAHDYRRRGKQSIIYRVRRS